MATLYLISGLPGSGKSRWLQTNPLGRIEAFDDFMAGALYDKPAFQCCRHLFAIVERLRTAHNVAMSDIRLCDPLFRAEVLNALNSLIGRVEVEWHCFENNSFNCKANARLRSTLDQSRPLELELRNIDRFSALYEPYPSGATVHPVVNYATLK